MITAVGDDAAIDVTIESASVNLFQLHISWRYTKPQRRPSQVEQPWLETGQVSGAVVSDFWQSLVELDPGHLRDDQRGVSLDGIGVHCQWNDDKGGLNWFSSWSPDRDSPRSTFARRVLSLASETFTESRSLDLMTRLARYL